MPLQATWTGARTIRRTDKVIDGLDGENVVVLGERQRRSEGRFGIVRFELPLSEYVEMIGFGRSPDVVDQLSVGHTAGPGGLFGEKALERLGGLEEVRLRSILSVCRLTEIAAVDRFSLRAVVFIAVRYFSISSPQRMYIFFLISNGRFSLLWLSAIYECTSRSVG